MLSENADDYVETKVDWAESGAGARNLENVSKVCVRDWLSEGGGRANVEEFVEG